MNTCIVIKLRVRCVSRSFWISNALNPRCTCIYIILEETQKQKKREEEERGREKKHSSRWNVIEFRFLCYFDRATALWKRGSYSRAVDCVGARFIESYNFCRTIISSERARRVSSCPRITTHGGACEYVVLRADRYNIYTCARDVHGSP